MKALYKWQKEAIKRFTRAVYFALAVDCSCGKTLAGISIAIRKKLPTIVIAPTHLLCGQWRDDILSVDGNADIWVYSKPEETKQGQKYRERFEKWLAM